MTDFIWIEWNIQKVANHYLAPHEVEFAWRQSVVVGGGDHPENGPYYESVGVCPSGRVIQIVWRYDVDRDGDEKVFVITAY